jgi:hypothetical protein
LTATLRNLADISQNREKFINCQIIEGLTVTLKYYTSDCDLVLNIARIFRFVSGFTLSFEANKKLEILSKLTLHADCCSILNECLSCYKSFIKAMIKHELKQVNI